MWLTLCYLEVAPFASLFRLRPLRYIGTISYGVYVFHQSVNGLLHRIVLDKASPALRTSRHAAVSLLAVVVTIALAAASYHWFERRFLAIGLRQRDGAGARSHPERSSTERCCGRRRATVER